MKTAFQKNFRFVLLATILVGLFAAGQTAHADEMSDLKERFASRLPLVRAAKDAGLIGETAAGKLEGVKTIDAKTQSTVDEENADRGKLYDLIATKESTTADVVARNNAIRNFNKAKSGDWLKSEGGQWAQKK